MTLMEMPVRRKPSRNGRASAAAAVARRAVADPYEPADDDREFAYRLTVDQYHWMIDTAVLEEGIPVELLDGRLVWKDRSARGEDPMTVGKGHAFSLDAVADLIARFARLGTHLRI